MDSSVIIALIGALGSALGSLCGVIVSAKLTNYRLEQLENKVAKHNNFAERIPVVEEQIKVLNHRVGDLENK